MGDVEPGSGPATTPITDVDEPSGSSTSSTATSAPTVPAQPAAAAPTAAASPGGSTASEPAPGTPAPTTAGGATKRSGLLKALVAVVLLVALVAAGPWLLHRTLGWSVNWANPFQQQVVDQSGAPVMLSLQDLSTYHAASGYYELVIDQQVDVSNLPSFLAGERVLFVAAGTVDATVDFGAIGPDSVQINDDRTAATINLPGVTLAKPVLDLDRSYVADRDRGLTERLQDAFGSGVSSDLDMQQLYSEAERRLAEAGSRTDDLVSRAEQNTHAMLVALLGEVGFTQVTVNFGAPVTNPS
ncbi:DUF4230 domain-containing protein [Millisia brevis]|uniref:DUF4230 domain-containing protein n=1 Tax=Millisia brevis TaxID=264148 RepID=UPI00082DC272|nr:DUF4230 domain-containing protein [Millisia brevis]